MQIITTLLLLVGLFIMWLTKYRDEKSERERVIKKKRAPDIKTEIIDDDDFNEDLTKRHLKGTLEEKKEVEVKTPSSLEKIDHLPIYKRGVIWKEILDLPVSER